MPKCYRQPDETTVAAGPVTKKVDVKKEDQRMEVDDVMEPAASCELGSHLVEVMRKVREAM